MKVEISGPKGKMKLFCSADVKIEVGNFEKNAQTGIREIPIYWLFRTAPKTMASQRIKVRVGSITRCEDGPMVDTKTSFIQHPANYQVKYEAVDGIFEGLHIMGGCPIEGEKISELIDRSHFRPRTDALPSLSDAMRHTYYYTLAEAKSEAKTNNLDDGFYWKYERIVKFNFFVATDICTDKEFGGPLEFWKALSLWDGTEGCAVLSVDVQNQTITVGNPPPHIGNWGDGPEWHIGTNKFAPEMVTLIQKGV